MKESDAKALLGLLGECCCCCDDEPPSAAGAPLPLLSGTAFLPITTRPVRPAPGQSGGLPPSSMPSRRRGVIDEPFVPAQTPSFDTPQRPGLGHLPEVLKDGLFSGSGDQGWGTGLILDDGQSVNIDVSTVDHHARTVRFVDRGAGSTTTYASLSLQMPPQVIQPDNGGTYWKEFSKNGKSYGDEAGTATTTRTIRLQPYDPTISATAALVVASGSVMGRRLRLIGDYTDHEGYVAEGGTLYARNIYNGQEYRRALTAPGTYPFAGASDYLVEFLGAAAPLPPADTPSWRSPDEQIRVEGGGWRRDHARLVDDQEQPLTLIAYGHALVGGSWAACCGPTLEDGSAPAWIIHEAGELVTRVTPEGQADTLARSVFEVEILRVKPGTFQRFSALGTLFNSWPPQWALCEIETDKTKEVRAVGRHDPWRDSVAARRPPTSLDPDWWYWPTRPKRRPRTLPATAPSAPLNLALADVGISGKGGGGET